MTKADAGPTTSPHDLPDQPAAAGTARCAGSAASQAGAAGGTTGGAASEPADAALIEPYGAMVNGELADARLLVAEHMLNAARELCEGLSYLPGIDGETDLDKWASDVDFRLHEEACKRLIETPARTMTGAKAKARALLAEMHAGRGAPLGNMALSLARDLERLEQEI